MGLDVENFGKPSWNPFKELIKPGDMVVSKLNMVMHKNGNKQFTLDCSILMILL